MARKNSINLKLLNRAKFKTIDLDKYNTGKFDLIVSNPPYIPSRDIKNFFYRCMKKKSIKKEWMRSTSGYLLYSLLEALFKQVQPILNKIGKELNNIEQDVFEGEQNTELVKELAIYRRNILSLRRMIDPQRYLMANLSHIRKPFLNEETSLYYDDINDYLNKVWAIIDTYRDTIQGLMLRLNRLLPKERTK